ncbi:hypothetical protein ABVT39_024785 [Epinephelus coioides]
MTDSRSLTPGGLTANKGKPAAGSKHSRIITHNSTDWLSKVWKYARQRNQANERCNV